MSDTLSHCITLCNNMIDLCYAPRQHIGCRRTPVDDDTPNRIGRLGVSRCAAPAEDGARGWRWVYQAQRPRSALWLIRAYVLLLAKLRIDDPVHGADRTANGGGDDPHSLALKV